MAATAGVESMTLRMKGFDSTKAPPRPTNATCITGLRRMDAPFVRTSTRQTHAFSVVGPSVWNGLPLALRLFPGLTLTHSTLALKLLFLAVLKSRALLSSNFEEVLYKST